MICTTAKQGIECIFMDKKGCQFNGGNCHQIVEKCGDCNKIKEFPTGKYCLSFPDPAIKWRLGTCSLATHVKTFSGERKEKVNPLKASKRKMRDVNKDVGDMGAAVDM